MLIGLMMVIALYRDDTDDSNGSFGNAFYDDSFDDDDDGADEL